jgi:iron(III) transport system permease protein
LPLGILLAVALAKTNVPGRRSAELLSIALLFVPLYMLSGAWDAGFGIQGWLTLATNPHLAQRPWLSGWRAAVWIHTMAAVPWVALIVATGLRSVEAELEEDALLRMPAHHVVRRVTLRRASGAIVVAAIWVAIVASAEISVTDVYQYRTFAEEVYTQAALGAFDFAPPADNGLAAASQAAAAQVAAANPSVTSGQPVQVDPALSVRSLWFGLGLSTIFVVALLLTGGQLLDDLVHAPERRPWQWRLRAGRWPAAIALWIGLFVVAGVPLANLIYKAGVLVQATDAGRVRSWSAIKVVEGVAAAPWQFCEELWQSAEIGTAAATAALMLGLPLAWSMRGGSLPWLRMGAIALVIAVPGPLLGIAMIRLLNQPTDSPLAFLAPLYDTNFAPWLVQTLRALPIVTLILWPSLASVPQAMLDTAATDGAGWWRRLLSIAIPQRWPAIAAAWLVGLAIAVGELAATVLVVPPGPTTISVRIFSLIHYGVDDRVASICLVLILGLTVMMMLAARWLPSDGPNVAVNPSDSLK